MLGERGPKGLCPSGVQGAEPSLGVWGQSLPPEAGIFVYSVLR